jgi:hypothetical protein
MKLDLFSYKFEELNFISLPAEVEAVMLVRVELPPAGLDLDDILLSELSRDLPVADFGRAKK